MRVYTFTLSIGGIFALAYGYFCFELGLGTLWFGALLSLP